MSDTSQGTRYDLDELGSLLEEAIQEQGFTMAEAADRFGCTTRHLRRVRDGGYPNAAARFLRRLGYEVQMYAIVEEP